MQTYLAIRAGTQEPEYLVPELKPILEKTNGWIIFQEEIMEICKQLCGYTGSEADEMRKAVGKKKAKLMAKHESKFKEGWIKHGLSKETANKMWSDIVGFATYGFCAAHGTSYGIITYQTAWLKTHYPREFMCAVMVCEGGNQDDMIKCLTECKRLKIKVLAPDINESEETFQLNKNGDIYFGLGPIKNVGVSVSTIAEERKAAGPFKNLQDFCERVDLSQINRLKLESLIKAGAFDKFGKNRATLLQGVEAIWEYRRQMKSYESKLVTFTNKMTAYEQRLTQIENGIKSSKGQKLKPFKLPIQPERPTFPELHDIDEMSEHDIWKDEHDLLGAFVSSHPMDRIRERVRKKEHFNTIKEVKTLPSRTSVTIPAVVTNIHEVTTKAKKKMAFATIEDLTGSIEVTLFPSVFERVGHLLAEARPLRISGAVDVAEGDEDRVTKITVRTLRVLDLKESTKPAKIKAQIHAGRAARLARILKELSGNVHEVEVMLILNDGTEVKLSHNPRIGDNKGAFNRELGRIRDEQQNN